MNSFSIVINGTDVTAYCPFPPKTESLLDERLDMARIDLAGYPGGVFPYMAEAEITFTDYTGTSQTVYYLVSADYIFETPVGSGLYDHNIDLIEETKYLECFLVDTQTYTNRLVRNYEAIEVTPIIKGDNPLGVGPTTPDSYVSPLSVGDYFVFESINTVLDRIGPTNGLMTVSKDGTQEFQTSNLDQQYATTMSEGTYRVTYYWQIISGTLSQEGSVVYYFEVLPITYPQVWNIASVIDRLLTIAEPLRRNDGASRFSLDSSIRSRLSAIEAPEFAFTTDTLREALNQIGGFIHAMPRLKRWYPTPVSDFQYVVSFDFYGGMEESSAASYPYVAESYGADIESYATKLDSQVNNLVNSMQDGSGTITEPYYDGYKTVRTETAYARISDSGMIIETQFPIYDVISVKAGILPGQTYEGGDITPYVFESADYSRMSSVMGTYPTSKMYAIYFVQGEKNIMGLDFKRPNAISEALEKYAIVNILRVTSGHNDFDMLTGNDPDPNAYAQLAFQITYRPIWSARVQQTKSNIDGILKPRALAYNQSANLIESRYYGENLKGTIARIGNVGRSRTFIGQKLSSIPKCGQLFDEDYYIAGVSVEWGVFDYKCTLAMSKDFNRLSQYIGIDAQKRYYEVSEKAAYNRNINLTDYLVIGDSMGTADYTYFGSTGSGLSDISKGFKNRDEADNDTILRVTHVIAEGYSDSNAADPDLPSILLPVISCPLGNGMVFSFSYADNYSAGNQAVYNDINTQTGEGDVTGYFQQGTAYADTYGRMEFLRWRMYAWRLPPSGANAQEEQTEIGTLLPQRDSSLGYGGWAFATVGESALAPDHSMWVKKDSREILSINYQIEFVTNRKNLVIGSGFAKTCPLVFNRTSGGAQLWILPNKINKFAQTIDTTGGINLGYVTPTAQNGILTFQATTATADGEAWAFLDSEVKEEGSTIRELIFGENTAVTSGEAIDLPVMTPKHKLF